MRYYRNKKGALNLSINAIVVLIVAIVFLGLALSFTRGFLKKTSSKLESGIDTIDLTTPPSSENPITFDDKLEIKIGKTKTFKIGFYNDDTQTAFNASPKFLKCSGGYTVPEIKSIPTNVNSYSEMRFVVSISIPSGMSEGEHICSFGIVNGGNISNVYEETQLTTIVTS